MRKSGIAAIAASAIFAVVSTAGAETIFNNMAKGINNIGKPCSESSSACGTVTKKEKSCMKRGTCVMPGNKSAGACAK